MLTKIEHDLKILRKLHPLIFNITNYVTMDFMANALMAMGASPIMSQCEEETEELLRMAGAVNVNIGTLCKEFLERSLYVAKIASRMNRPVVLDPSGCGSSLVRTEAARKLLPYADIVVGNPSEIIALSGGEKMTLGVQSTHTTAQAKESARAVAKQYHCLVVVSRKESYITDGLKEMDVGLGSPLIDYVTGMGGALSATVAAFSATNRNFFESATNAVIYFSLCGALANQKVDAPASFRVAIIDELYRADFERMKSSISEAQFKILFSETSSVAVS